MPDTFGQIQTESAKVAPFVSWVQVDVMDGNFVPSVSWPYGENDVADLEKIRTGDLTLPEHEGLHYEVDLMVDDLETEVTRWAKTQAERLIVHVEALKSADELEYILMKYRVSGVREIGIALGADTSLESIAPILGEVDMVQCMGIARIGYQGQEFDPRVLDLIRGIREIQKTIPISVDGSVNLTTAPDLIAAGATRLVSGSAVFQADDIETAIKNLQEV